jgi:hypothetical protein
MRLAEDEITVRLSGTVAYLRPSLRAAFRLERKYQGFDAIIRAIVDENLTVIADVIHECSDQPTDIPRLIDELGLHPLRVGIEALSVPAANVVLALAGIDDDDSGRRAEQIGDRISFAEYHERLYRIGTGWLGWSPDTTWDATPAEIIEAYKGHLEMLRAIHGGTEPDTPDPDAGLDEAGWRKLKHMAATGANRAP